MKRIIGYLSILLLTLLTLVSCSKPSVYKLYKDEHVDLGKDTVYQLVTADEFKSIKDNTTEIVYLFYGSHKDMTSKGAITLVQEQAKQFEIKVVYYIDANEYNTTEKRNKLKETIGINDPKITDLPTLLAYNCADSEGETKDAKYTFDTSISDFARCFKTEDNKLDYTLISGFMFRDKCAKEKMPKL